MENDDIERYVINSIMKNDEQSNQQLRKAITSKFKQKTNLPQTFV